MFLVCLVRSWPCTYFIYYFSIDLIVADYFGIIHYACCKHLGVLVGGMSKSVWEACQVVDLLQMSKHLPLTLIINRHKPVQVQVTQNNYALLLKTRPQALNIIHFVLNGLLVFRSL